MMVPEYMRFYGQGANDVLRTTARTFFSLVNCMYRLKAREVLSDILSTSAAMNDKSGSVISQLEKQERGIAGIVEEIKVVKRAKK